MLDGSLSREASLKGQSVEEGDAVAESLEGFFVRCLDDVFGEDVSFVPDAFDLDLELEWTEFKEFDDLQVGSVDKISSIDEGDILLDVDLLVHDLGRDVLFLEEVGHLDVNVGSSCWHDHVDIALIPVVSVGAQGVLLDQFGHLAQVA